MHRECLPKKDFIFAKMERQYGYPIVVINVRDRMKRLLKVAGLNEDLTLHSLRHTSLPAEVGLTLEQKWIVYVILKIKFNTCITS